MDDVTLRGGSAKVGTGRLELNSARIRFSGFHQSHDGCIHQHEHGQDAEAELLLPLATLTAAKKYGVSGQALMILQSSLSSSIETLPIILLSMI